MKLDGEVVVEANTKRQNCPTLPRSKTPPIPMRARTMKEGVRMKNAAHREPTQVPMRALAKIMTSAEELGLSCIGVSGITQACGASQIAHDLACAFADFGRETLLVTASIQDDTELPSSVEVLAERLGVIKISERQFSGKKTSSRLRDVIHELAGPYSQIVVDLPAVYRDDLRFNIGLKEIGSLCDSTYLVCETAGHSQAELANAVDFCQLSKVDLAGWVLNDQRIKFQRLVSDQ